MNGSSIEKIVLAQQEALKFICSYLEQDTGLITTKRSEERVQALQKTKVFRARDKLVEADEVIRNEAVREESAKKFIEKTS